MRHLGEARFCPHCAAPLETRVPPGDGRARLVCSACGEVLYVGPKVAAGTVTALDGGVVLIRRGVEPRAGFWSFPCGFVESDETAAEGAIRETREECGLEVALDGMLGCYSYPANADAPSGLVIVAFRGRVTGGTLRPGDDATDAQVVPTDAIPWDDLAFRSSHAALRDWLGSTLGPEVDHGR